MMRCRGIRGATTVVENTPEAILEATRELLALLVRENDVDVEEITSAFFTVTGDLNAAHPAQAARQLGWADVALLCATEIPVPGSLGLCIRVLLHVNTDKRLEEMRHIYLRSAAALRPDRARRPLSAASAAFTSQGEDR